MRGRFITLEGGEGTGKSTQLALLAAQLRVRHGLTVVETREPGGTAGAEAIRELLLHRDSDAWSARTEALLFAAARSDHVARLIEPALARGAWVLCDRYVDSSRAYQGSRGGLCDADILDLHRIGSGGLMPDRTLLLTLDADESRQRRQARALDRPDRFEERDGDFHGQVERIFVRLASAEPERFRSISASGSPEAVTAQLVAELADLLP